MPSRLGQNFLINKKVLKDIANALELKEGEVVVEIGPGHGELTIYLLESGARVVAIEKDRELANQLKEKYKNLEVIEGDALKVLPILNLENYKLAGNIPYYITGKLLRLIGDLENKPKLIVLTIQKEVAERIAAKPPRMNLLAASVQFWAEVKIVELVGKKEFRPIPEVDSAIIKLTPKSPERIRKKEQYYNFIKILFKQPRKTILNNLKEKYDPEKIKKILGENNIDPQARPQNLNIENISRIMELEVEPSRSKA